MTYKLLSKREASPIIAKALTKGLEFKLEVREDACFQGEQWLSLGTISVSCSLPEPDESPDAVNERAIWYGQFVWQLPSLETVASRLKELMGDADGGNERTIKAVEEGVQDIARRLLLVLPTFDPGYVADMPFRTPTTLVTDTSSVIQGALDFVTRFLFPMARVKVPSVVALEILNMTDRFMSFRRSGKAKKSATLASHIRSQGAQRALMRLEWHSDVEVERPIQGNDPLRSIFKDDSEPEFRSLNLTEVQRSYADRLVFESAKEHQSRLSANHPVSVLTSDQGLARMTLAEGMRPLYFEARRSPKVFGRSLSGCLLHPFRSELYTISLPSLIWELAACFGQARLRLDGTDTEFKAAAISTDLPWYPYQSEEDLLWCSWSGLEEAALSGTADSLEATAGPVSTQALAEAEPVGVHTETVPAGASRQPDFLTAYRFTPASMIRLIAELSQRDFMTEQEAMSVLGVNSPRSFRDYVTFLSSGGLVTVDSGRLTRTVALETLQASLISRNIDGIKEQLLQVPSFSRFLEIVAERGKTMTSLEGLPMRRDTVRSYLTLAELSGSALFVPGAGLFLTQSNPNPQEFADLALRSYEELATADPLVLSGEWMERLASECGIHPLRARDLLQKSYDLGLVKRFFEGSTPETRFERHSMETLDVQQGISGIKRVYLYHGDFLIQERSSVRIRLERIVS